MLKASVEILLICLDELQSNSALRHSTIIDLKESDKELERCGDRATKLINVCVELLKTPGLDVGSGD